MVQRMHGRRAPARPPRLTGSGRLRSAAGLADRGPADQQHQPAAPRCGGHLARTPNSAASTSRGTYFGGDLIGHSRHADRLMHPQQSRIGLSYADPPPGQRPGGLGLLHPAGDDNRHAAAFPAGMPPATYPRPAVPPAHCPRWRRPGERPRPAPAAPPSEPCRCPGESARPAARPRSWNLAGREPRQNMPPISTPAARGGYPGRVCAGSRGEHGEIINWPRTTAHSWRAGG